MSIALKILKSMITSDDLLNIATIIEMAETSIYSIRSMAVSVSQCFAHQICLVLLA